MNSKTLIELLAQTKECAARVMIAEERGMMHTPEADRRIAALHKAAAEARELAAMLEKYSL